VLTIQFFSAFSLFKHAKRVSVWVGVNPTLAAPSSLLEAAGRCSPSRPAKDAAPTKLWPTTQFPGIVKFWAMALAPGGYLPPWFAGIYLISPQFARLACQFGGYPIISKHWSFSCPIFKQWLTPRLV